MTVRFVTIRRASELTGYTEVAIRVKIRRGDWLQDALFVKAPDGRILIDMQNYEKWASGEMPMQHLAAAKRR